MSVNVVFLGPPGAGKSTQAKLLSERCGIPRLEMGEVLRELSRQDTQIGRQVKAYIDRGLLVPEAIVKQVIAEHIHQPKFQRGFIIDGFPRNVSQAKTFEKMLNDMHKKLDAVVLFEVSERVVVDRLSGRRVCLGCGVAFEIRPGQSAADDLCGRCGGKFAQRHDDRPEVVKARLDVFARETAPVVAFYENRHLLKRVDASKSVAAVFAALSSNVPCN